MSRRKQRTPETVDIVDLTHDGRGVARTTGKTLFVDGALPGETVEAIRLRKRKTHDEGTVLNLLVPAAERVDPQCPWFHRCGGCSLQHLAGPAQWAAKEKVLTDNLINAGKVRPETLYPPIHGPGLGYRRRARLGVRWVEGKGRVLVGFRERFSSFIADIEFCPVLAPPADRLIQPISELIAALSLKQRIPQVEVAVGDNRTALVFRVLEDPTDDDLQAFRQFRADQEVDIYLQRGGIDTVAALDGQAAPLVYRLPEFGLDYQFRPTDFIQVNAQINRQMIARAAELLNARPGSQILDLFSGLGNFALPLARRGASVTAVEGDAGLVQRAKENASRNDIETVRFFVANLFEDCRSMPWASRSYDAVLLDPPRSGAREILPLVAGTRRIVYVSCNPATLARDAGILVHDHGYCLEGAGIMDMFPQTAHMESIAVFVRN